MSDASGVTLTSNSWIQQAQNNPIEFLKSLEDLLENFGPEELGNASAKQFLNTFIDKLRELINDSDLPQGMKDMANAVLDSHQSKIDDDCPCSAEASEAVSCCSQSDDIDQAAEETAESSAESANECCSGSGSGSDEAEGAEGSGSSSSDMSPEAQAEADAEAENEGTSGSSGAGGAGGHDSMDELNDDQAQSAGEDKKKNKYANWLQALAGDLADIQATFLDRAMAAKDIMMKEAETAGSGEGKSAEFLDAQAQYTATMQLFTIFSNQTSTSIKSIGEALAGISRKQ